MVSIPLASPVRSSPREIGQSTRIVLSSEAFTKILDLFPEIVLILDRNHQAVYCNGELLKLLGWDSRDEVLGKRPGELFRCIHASREPGGCGTSEFCHECGAINAILTAQTGKPGSAECRITIDTPAGHGSLDLKVWASPIEIEKVPFTFFVIRNIGDEKRRAALERFFFHDILNDTTVLKSYAENVRDGIVPRDSESIENICCFSKRLSDAITDQRDLLEAEKGKFTPAMEEVEIAPLFREIVTLYERIHFTKNKKLLLQCPDPSARVTTDPQTLWRILINLVKNALEATPDHGTVTLGWKKEAGQTVFFVNNPTVLTEEVRHQIFQRSFSTKGEGRGIGTYSVRLFTEQYLKGKVWFESSAGRGTTFFVSLPAA